VHSPPNTDQTNSYVLCQYQLITMDVILLHRASLPGARCFPPHSYNSCRSPHHHTLGVKPDIHNVTLSQMGGQIWSGGYRAEPNGSMSNVRLANHGDNAFDEIIHTYPTAAYPCVPFTRDSLAMTPVFVFVRISSATI